MTSQRKRADVIRSAFAGPEELIEDAERELQHLLVIIETLEENLWATTQMGRGPLLSKIVDYEDTGT